MTIQQGNIVRRGDTGTFAVVISNSMLHTIAPWVMVCSINMTADHSHPAVVDLDEYAEGKQMRVVPTKLFTVPVSAVAEVIGTATEQQLRETIRIMHAATS